MSFPPFTAELRHLEDSFTVTELKELWYTIVEEVTLGEYAMRKHGTKLYNTGCRGPICRKANRVVTRLRFNQNPRKGGFERDQVIDYYETVALDRRAKYSLILQDELCKQVLDL